MQALFRRGQLKALVDLHSETEGLGGQLAAEEINVIRGALDLTNKTAAKGMTPLDKVGPHPSHITCFHVSNPRLQHGESTEDAARLSQLCPPLCSIYRQPTVIQVCNLKQHCLHKPQVRDALDQDQINCALGMALIKSLDGHTVSK